jgi:hypothetical protein
MRLLVLAALLLPTLALAAPKLEPSRLDVRVATTQLSDAGLDLTIELRDHCTVKLGGDERELPCSEWRPLPTAGAARKLLYKGDLEVNGKTKPMQLRGTHDGGETFTATVRRGTADAVSMEATDVGTWRLSRGAVGSWALGGDEDWTLPVVVKAGEVVLPISEGGSVELPASSWGRFASGWACDAMDWLAQNWSAAGVRPSALTVAPEDVCPDEVKAARAASCEGLEAVGHTLAQSGDPETLADLVADGDALAASCEGALVELRTSGDLAREYLVTTQDSAGLSSLAAAWGPRLGSEWAAATRKAAADAALQEARRTGQIEGLIDFLTVFPDTGEAPPVAAALLSISTKFVLPCGKKRGCPELPAESTISATWTDVPGNPATPRLMAWSKADGATSLSDALTAWADGAPPDEVTAAVESLAGEAGTGTWSLTLPFPLKRLGEAHDGYALELSPSQGPPVVVPIRVEADFGAFAGRSRPILLRSDGASRVDEPGGDAAALASVPLAVGNHLVHGRHLYVWTAWSAEGGTVGPDPLGLVRVDLDLGGLEVVLTGEPVADMRAQGDDLLMRLGAGCSLEAAVAANRSSSADPDTHPGAAAGPSTDECRTALFTESGLSEAPSDLPEAAGVPPVSGPEGLALVTDEVAGSPELFAVEEATGRRLQVSRAHALRKDYVVPSGCTDGSGFAWRWNPDGRLIVHHALAQCGDQTRGPLILVAPTDGASLVLAGETTGLPDWLDRAWTPDREALLTADGSVVVGPDLLPGDPAVLAAWWYRPRLIDVLR